MTVSTNPTRGHVAICVGQAGDNDLGRDFAHAIGGQDGGDTILRHLCKTGEYFAAEINLPFLNADEHADLHDTLAQQFSTRADTAILPGANRRKRLVICDMDSTIIGQECLDELADYAGKKAEVSAITERAMAGELDFDGALRARVAMLSGLGLDALQACYDQRITLNPGAATLIATMKADGARAVLVSGGFTFFTQRVARAAGFDAHRGNTLIDDGAALTGEVGTPILGRAAKREALEAECAALDLSPDDALTMGDGANDLAMIEASGLGIAYRAKPVVAEKADTAINVTDLRTALHFQGYTSDEFVEAG